MAGANVSLLRILPITAVSVNTLTGVQTAPQVSAGCPFYARRRLSWLVRGMSAHYRVAVQIDLMF